MSYRLDKTAFKQTKLEDQGNNRAYWMSRTPAERLAAAWYLTCRAYGIDPNNPPKMDKSLFRIKSRDE